jgi:signal transduction histidine kinase/CheY-like chemotaxis protein
MPYTAKESKYMLNAIKKHGKWVGEVELVTRNGRIFWGEVGITLLYLKNQAVYLIRITDITKKRTADEQLKKSEAALREAQKLARIGNYEFDLTTNNGIVSEEVYAIFEANPTDNFTLTYFTDRMPPTYRSTFYEIIVQASPTSHTFELEFKAIRSDSGASLYVQSYGKVIFNRTGKPVRVVGTIQDITERKLREIELVKAKSMAEQASIAKEQFLSTMSHELRTPINAILGMSHFLLQEQPKPEQVDNLKVLHYSAESLLMLINDILDLNKIEAGRIVFEEIDFNIRDMINRIQQSLRYWALEKNIQFFCRIDADLPQLLMGDPVRLGQVLTNLLSNAIKFTEDGSVTLEVELNREDEEYVEVNFSIIDTGIGIPANKLDYIFESFTQASSDTTRKFGWTGLGLSITKRLLELQNSIIYVKSKVGEGSGFYFTLRFKKSYTQKTLPQANYADPPATFLQGMRFLIVEDNEINKLVVAKFLQKWGIHTDHAVSGREAIEKVRQQEYNLILMDLQMPQMDGYETTCHIRSIEGSYFRNVPIIALTASAMSDVKGRVLEHGMNDYVTKPFKPNDLYEKIVRYVGTSAAGESREKGNANEKVPLQLNYQKIIDLTSGNEDFQALLTQSYIRLFKQLKNDYTAALLAEDMTQLKFVINYIEPPFAFLEVHDLKEEVTNGLRLIEKSPVNLQALTQSVEKVALLCDNFATQLEERLLLSKGIGV